MKKICIGMGLGCLLSISSFAGVSFTLDNPALTLIDGKSFGVHGEVFGLMLQNRRDIRKCVYGVPTKSGGRQGMYEFEGKKYNLGELEVLEREAMDAGDNERIAALKVLLEEAKDHFIGLTIGYVQSISKVKEPLMMLLEEFCEKRGVQRCFLLRWGEAAAGTEEELIRKELGTFKDFREFCEDLSNFLEVLARSCPKGMQQFKEMIKKAKQ